MSHKSKKRGLRLTLISLEIIIGVGLIFGALKYRSIQDAKKGAELAASKSELPKEDVSIQPRESATKPDNSNAFVANEPIETEPIETLSTPSEEKKVTIFELVDKARTWGSTLNAWPGKEMPDFTLKDIEGREHKLSDYRGKDVMIIFWGTWCGPCLQEIPGLIRLRRVIGEDKLAMLAISFEQLEVVQKFVIANRLNYTVFSTDVLTLPIPYSLVNSLPTTLFITPEGKLKVATVGFMTTKDVTAILTAEE